MEQIVIEHATQGNLRDVSLAVPKGSLVVFTGLSGSGKSTLLIDVLFNECQRQYLEAMGMAGIRKPCVGRIRNASPAVLVSPGSAAKNPRSTVGTVTDAYTDLRMVFEKLAVRLCPSCGEPVCAAECREETERIGDEFAVSMHCNRCGFRMDKLTRTDFSFNTHKGACPVCEGLGEVHDVALDRVLDESLSLEDGAVSFWPGRYRDYQITALYRAYRHFGLAVPEGVPVARFDERQRTILLDGVANEEVSREFAGIDPPKTHASGRFEGIRPMLKRKLAEREGDAKSLEDCFDTVMCPACRGERLGVLGRSATIAGVRLPELSQMTLVQLLRWVEDLAESLEASEAAMVGDYLRDLSTKLARLERVGLGYLSLDRQTSTLSGGELQRMRLASVLDSDLTGVIYIMDEPTVGLHPGDTAGLVAVLKALRDRGNSVLVIEHDPDVMREADFVIDMGPGAGKEGGQVVASGTLEEVCRVEASVTGRFLATPRAAKASFRPSSQVGVAVRNARLHNLRGFDVDIPRGCLTTISGVSGSGKTTLLFDIVARGDRAGSENAVSGIDGFDRVVEVGQAPIARMKRSNVATYTDAYADIRKLFAGTEAARERGFSAKHFSFNVPGGRCERCEGLGSVTSNMLFFLDVEVTCPVCQGARFRDEVAAVSYRGLTINDVLGLSVSDAAAFFSDRPRLARTLGLLVDVGLGYLELGQTLTTLSGGEAQRLKLARELVANKGTVCLYLLDEPTCGLHPEDTERFLDLIDRLVDAGGTVVVVEHNLQVIERSDWVIDLGPEGGDAGGELLFAGTPADLRLSETATAAYLRR